ncbi:MAG: cytoskeletal protein CcmA (bactofilin family) [Saprospiraceae bacterium]|jgi:cytoskeletal protein CcmA (bactofilin family)
MGLFNKSNQQTDIQTNATIISSGTTVNGDIVTGSTLHIDGTYNGKVRSKSSVTIGKQGSVEGEVNAKSLSITGTFHGNADCDEIEILSGGNVKGKIVTSHLSIDHNCNFEGESIKRASSSVPQSISKISQEK